MNPDNANSRGNNERSRQPNFEVGHSDHTHYQLIADRLRLNAYARFGVIAFMIGVSFFAVYVLEMERLNLSAVFILGGSMAAYTTIFLLLSYRLQRSGITNRRVRWMKFRLVASVLLDFIALTIAIWIAGGTRSPFLSLYLFHLAITAFLLSRRAALSIMFFSIVLLVGLVLFELFEIIEPGLDLFEVPLSRTYAISAILVYSTLFILVSLTATGLVDQLRRTEKSLLRKSFELKQLLTMRREFQLLAMHNMTSPVDVVTMLLQNLHSGVLGKLDPKHDEQIVRAIHRLEGLEKLLADLRKLSELRRADLRDQSVEVSLKSLLDDVADEHWELAENKSIQIHVDTSSADGTVFGVSRLLQEALSNFMSNAIKYTKENGEIRLKVEEHDGLVRAEVTDSGVGMTPEDANRVFEEFVRVGKNDPAIKGSGLGLSLVKQIAHAHNGSVGVESELGVGSTFWLEIPSYESSLDESSTNPTLTPEQR